MTQSSENSSMTPHPSSNVPTRTSQAIWSQLEARMQPELVSQIRRWQNAPQAPQRANRWSMIVVKDGAPVQILTFPKLKELVTAARDLYRESSESHMQILIFRGRIFPVDRTRSRRLILSPRRKISLVPIDRREDLDEDFLADFIDPLAGWS